MFQGTLVVRWRKYRHSNFYSTWQQRRVFMNRFSDGRCWLEIEQSLNHPTFTIPIISPKDQCWKLSQLQQVSSVYLELNEVNVSFQVEVESMEEAETVLVLLNS
jgi:hypothetical protein